MKIKTKSGFVCEIDENRADDWDFCDYLLMCDSQATMVQGIKKAVPFLLGEKNENALKEHVKEKFPIFKNIPLGLLIKSGRRKSTYHNFSPIFSNKFFLFSK